MPRKAPLAAPAELERICRGLAALDAILCEDWEDRAYSFDARWNARRKERMAQWRNGSGDEMFIVFAPAGAFVKAFYHEHGDAGRDAIYAGIPKALAANVTEPAFNGDEGMTTWGGWYAGGWTLRGNAEPVEEELEMLRGKPATYRAFAEAIYDEDVPLAVVRDILAGTVPDADLVAKVAPDRDFAELRPELVAIYGPMQPAKSKGRKAKRR